FFMRKIGSFIAVIGCFAIILKLMNRVPSLLTWMYNWGQPTSWIIKFSTVAIGLTLYLLGKENTPQRNNPDIE
ncbi:hypothetical protein, partial [Tenacibaculum maritimum]